jgi:ribosomal-protein-alanine N-acetyltransferase
MNIHIETPRFIIRDIEETDVQGIYDLDSNPAVHEYLGKKPIQTIQEAERIIAHVRAQYVKNGIGRWAIEDKESGDFIGWTGLKREDVLRPGFSYYDLGYRLRQKYWGKGIASESAIECLSYGFEKMNLNEIGAAADVHHVASNRILSKIGMNLIEVFEYDGDPTNWYNLTKVDWVNGL